MKPQQIIELLKSKGVEAYVDPGSSNRSQNKCRIRSEWEVDINGTGALIASGHNWEEVAESLKGKGLI
jgi:hypothetical protein